MKKLTTLFAILVIITSFGFSSISNNNGLVRKGKSIKKNTDMDLAFDSKILSYSVDVKTKNVKLYWKDSKGLLYNSIFNLKSSIEKQHQKLLFATNGGMYMENHNPLGLFIQNYKTITKLNTRNAKSNFYIKPNGVFYITNNKRAVVCTTADFKNNGDIKYATQSGPMLVVNGTTNKTFLKASTSLCVRNGVGIMPNGIVVFAMSKEPMNFYEFAKYFKEKGCVNALYLDGCVSKTFLQEKQWLDTGGNFGVIIGVTQ